MVVNMIIDFKPYTPRLVHNLLFGKAG